MVPTQKVLKTFEKRANQGDIDAMKKVASFYQDGKCGAIKNIEKALYWYRKAAESGDAISMFNCSNIIGAINADDPDKIIESFEWLKLAVEIDNELAQAVYQLAQSYNQGVGCEVNIAKTIMLLHQAAELGLPEALYDLSAVYKLGIGTNINLKYSLSCLQKAADKDYPDAMSDLAKVFWMGKYESINIKPDSKKAFELARRAAALGDTDAKQNLAHFYLSGIGCPADPSLGFKILKGLVSDSIDPSAMHDLAACYFHGEGCEKNEKQFIKWMTKAAEAGLLTAQQALYNYYRNKKESNKELIYLEMASGNGDGEASFILAKKMGTNINDTEYYRLLKKSGNQGSLKGVTEYTAISIFQDKNYQEAVNMYERFILPDKTTENYHLTYAYELLKENYITDVKAKALLYYFLNQLYIDTHYAEPYKITEAEIPIAVNHYTNVAALQNMIKKDEKCQSKNHLWMFHTEYMNDPEEGKYLYNSIDSVSIPYTDKWIKDIKTKDNKTYHTFLSCFSGCDYDELNMWRLYGNDAKGICISIPIKYFKCNNVLQSITRNTEKNNLKPSLYKVNYSKETVEELYKKIEKWFAAIEKSMSLNKRKNKKEIKVIIFSFFSFIFDELKHLFKSPNYEVEKEFRILSYNPPGDNEILISDSEMPKLYVPTSYFLFQKGTKIIIGPKAANKEELKLELEHRLLVSGYEDVEVLISKAKYK